MRNIVVLLVAAAASSVAMGQSVTLSQGLSSGNGGEFNAQFNAFALTPAALTNSGLFEVFCLERSENFQPGGTYLFSIDTVALLGGGGAIGGQDPLDETTAYLYNAFITGTLPLYDYANSAGQRQHLAGAVQNAIWFLENEVATLDSAEAVFYYNFAQAGIGQGLGDVRVLNLYSVDGHGNIVYHQSQIFKLPTPGSVSLAALALGMTARRRRR